VNVIWIIADTLRRKDVGVYGNKIIITPSMDKLAARSIRFDRHYMASFPTMPARADFATGRWTLSYMQWEPLFPDEVTLAQLIRKGGIQTTAVVDTPFYLRNAMGYDRGFQTFFEIPGQYHQGQGKELFRGEAADIRAARRGEIDCFAAQTFSSAMRWLERHYRENFFLYIDTWDPHEPWDPPHYYTERYYPGYDDEIVRPLYGYWQQAPGFSEEKVKKAYAAYCGKVTMVDTWLGFFLTQLENMNLMKNTAVIFTTDHGYYFGEHGGLFGKMVFDKDPKSGKNIMGVWSKSPLYEEVSAIPLFIYVPNIQPFVYCGLTSAVDLMPTVLDILNLEIPPSVEGRSLLPGIKDNSVSGREYVISAHPFINPGDEIRSVDDVSRPASTHSSVTVTTDEWSLLYEVDPNRPELYHLKVDPEQKNNVIYQYPDKARELHQILVKFMGDTKVQKRMMEPRLHLRI
jgi:arylsulfatase A-like enzyme